MKLFFFISLTNADAAIVLQPPDAILVAGNVITWPDATFLVPYDYLHHMKSHICLSFHIFVESRVTTDTLFLTLAILQMLHARHIFKHPNLCFFMLFISQYPAKVSSASLYGLASQLRTRMCMHATHCSSHTDFGVIPQDTSVHLSCTGDVGAGWFRVSSGIYVPSRRAQATWGRR